MIAFNSRGLLSPGPGIYIADHADTAGGIVNPQFTAAFAATCSEIQIVSKGSQLTGLAISFTVPEVSYQRQRLTVVTDIAQSIAIGVYLVLSDPEVLVPYIVTANDRGGTVHYKGIQVRCLSADYEAIKLGHAARPVLNDTQMHIRLREWDNDTGSDECTVDRRVDVMLHGQS